MTTKKKLKPTPKPKVLLCRSCTAYVRRGLLTSGQIQPETCATCHNCHRCGCVCVHCRRCDKRVPSNSTAQWCVHCETCKAHCTCRKMPNAQEIRIYSPQLVNTLPRTLGIELELANWGNLRRIEPSVLHYSVAHDWSVKPSEEELVSDPMQGDQYLQAMMELAKMVHVGKAQVNDTCAYHVHVGAKDLSYFEIRRLLRVYCQLEAEIYDYLILPHRRDVPRITHYCQMLTQHHRECERCERYDSQYPRQRRMLVLLPEILKDMNHAKTTGEIKKSLARMLYSMNLPGDTWGRGRANPAPFDQLQTRKGGRYEWARYVGLNLHAWMYRGTIEWRMKEGTTEVEELINWPLWCGWFVQAMQVMKEEESLRPWTVTSFTYKFMPKFLAKWVERKIVEAKERPKDMKTELYDEISVAPTTHALRFRPVAEWAYYTDTLPPLQQVRQTLNELATQAPQQAEVPRPRQRTIDYDDPDTF